jgi:uncharacterized protein (TIGR02118 family)
MVRVFVLYEAAPDPERYEQHVALCHKVPGATFRHGAVKRTLSGSELGYYAEFEFPDSDTFKAAAATDEFKATGTDAAEMGIPHSVYVADVNA